MQYWWNNEIKTSGKHLFLFDLKKNQIHPFKQEYWDKPDERVITYKVEKFSSKVWQWVGRLPSDGFIYGDLTLIDKNEGNYTFVYSDMQTGLQVHILNTNLPIETNLIIYVQGYFFNKEFQFGQEVKVTGERCRNGVKELELVVQYPEVIWRREIQTHNNVGSQRRKMDPHERRSVYIKDSPIPGAGEGVFAKRSYGPRDLISYFGGLKTVRENFIFPNLTENEIKNVTSYFYNFGFKVPAEWKIKKDLVIDIPHQYRSIVEYRTTLGHKVNHAFQIQNDKPGNAAVNFRYANAEVLPCIHPYLGKLLCLLAGMYFVRLVIIWFGIDAILAWNTFNLLEFYIHGITYLKGFRNEL